MDRRQFLSHTGLLRLGWGAAPRCAAAPPRSYAAEYPDMLLAYFARELQREVDRWDAERAKIRTAADVDARNGFVREKILEMLGPWPERNPLMPVTCGVLQRESYRVENVMFQSRPGFWVAGNLYVPPGPGPFPAIISPCGHYPQGRMYPEYQYAYLNLVHAGFVVLAYDPIGQGERRQYWNPSTSQTEERLGPIHEHSMPGQLLMLIGENLTHYRVWDGIRAIDYLLTRTEVDPKRIGCAGHSGGGTMTMFISAVDERVRCAVVNEGGMFHRWPFIELHRNGLTPSDVEQNLFPAAIYGVDSCDVHVAIAPRPLLALVENYVKWFDDAAAHIRVRYEQLGVPEKFATAEANDPHAWTPKLRQATTDWFSRWFYGRPGPAREPEFRAERPEALYCTGNGSVRYSQKGETIFSLILSKQSSLPPKRERPRAGAELGAFRAEMQDRIRKVLRYADQRGELRPQQLVTTQRKGYQIEKLEFLSEPGIYIPVWVFNPEERNGAPTMLYFDEAGKQRAGMEFGLLEALARQGHQVIAADVRGIGETRSPNFVDLPGYSHLFNTETAMAYNAWYLDRSLFGMRVFDVVRTVDYATSRPEVDHAGVAVIGCGMGALWAMYAAALDGRIRAAICEAGLLSYHCLTAADRYMHSAGVFVSGVLLEFDLPQVAAAIAGRGLALVAPVNHMKETVSVGQAQEVYRWTTDAFAAAAAADRFRILGQDSAGRGQGLYPVLIKEVW